MFLTGYGLVKSDHSLSGPKGWKGVWPFPNASAFCKDSAAGRATKRWISASASVVQEPRSLSPSCAATSSSTTSATDLTQEEGSTNSVVK